MDPHNSYKALHPSLAGFGYRVSYLYNEDGYLDQAPSMRDRIDSTTMNFFTHHPLPLGLQVRITKSEPFIEWLESHMTHYGVLAVVSRGKYPNPGGTGVADQGGCFFVLQTEIEGDLWEEWPHAGPALDFQRWLYNPEYYPQELIDLLGFGSIHLHNWYAGPRFYPLGMDNRISTDQREYEFYKSKWGKKKGYPIDQFRIALGDPLGGYLMYDRDFNIWCGSAEEEILWKTELDFTQLIDSVFNGMLRDRYPDVYDIGKGKYLKRF